MPAAFVYATTSTKEEALKIGRILVTERLAACANVLDGMTSVYWWEGKLEESTEAIMIAKTTDSLVDPLIERVKQLHSYDCPCVVAWPILQGNEQYLEWIQQETGQRSADN